MFEAIKLRAKSNVINYTICIKTILKMVQEIIRSLIIAITYSCQLAICI